MKKIIYVISFLCVSSLSADWAQETLDAMSLKQKVGQVFMPRMYANVDTEYKMIAHLITQYEVGGVILLIDPLVGRQTPVEQAHLITQLQEHTSMPLLISQDLEWGLAMRLRDVVKFPHNMTLGAMQNKELIYDLGLEIGRQCTAMGVHINFAPVVDVNSNAHNPVIGARAFGSDVYKVTECALEYINGLRDAGVIACAKHFPGHGDTAIDSHVDVPCIKHSREILEERELYPFKKMIEANVPMVMVGHLQVTSLDDTNRPASLSSSVITRLLKGELGFKGIVVTDGLKMGGITRNFTSGQAAVMALCAGNDLLIDSEDPVEAIEAVIKAVEDTSISEERLNESVLKILRLKESLGLTSRVNKNMPSSQEFHTQHAYALKGKLYQQAITLVRDREFLIPCTLSQKTAAVFIEDEPVTLHTYFSKTPYTAFSMSPLAHQKDVHQLIDTLTPFDTVIIGVFGMNNYMSKNCGVSDETLDLIHQLQLQRKKVVVVLFGTPYALSLFDNVGTLIVAYESDVDAQFAAARVVIGKEVATGQLPI